MSIMDRLNSLAASLGGAAGSLARRASEAFVDAARPPQDTAQTPAAEQTAPDEVIVKSGPGAFLGGGAPDMGAVVMPTASSPAFDVPDPVDALFKAAKKEEPGPAGYAFDPVDAIGRITSDANLNPTHPGTDGMPWWMLEKLASMSVPALVINHAVAEVCEFAKRQTVAHTFGFRLRLADTSRHPTKAEKLRMTEIERVIERGGGKYQSGGFEGTVRRFMRESLVYDAAPIEILEASGFRNTEPMGMFVYDAQSVRRREPSQQYYDRGQWGESGYVQWVLNRVVAEWDEPEMIYGIRNPRVGMRFVDYGFPELHMLWNVLVNFGRAENYNAVNFTSGIHSSSLLAIMSTMDRTAFSAMRRTFDANFSQAAAKRRMPIIQLDPSQKEDIKSVNLSNSNKEMEFTNWLFYNVKLVCAAYGVDPVAALNMQFGNEGQSALNSSGPAERYEMSRARGLRPRLRSIESWINSKFLPRFKDGETFVFEFTGFDSLTEGEKLDIDKKMLESFMSVNEIRARYDLKPIPGSAGDVIANPYISQAQSMDAMNQQQGGEGGGMDMGMGGEMPPGEEEEPEAPFEDFDDASLMASLYRDPKHGGSINQITKSLAGPVAEAVRRGLVKPPPTWRPGKPWSIVSRGSQREPIVVQVRV